MKMLLLLLLLAGCSQQHRPSIDSDYTAWLHGAKPAQNCFDGTAVGVPCIATDKNDRQWIIPMRDSSADYSYPRTCTGEPIDPQKSQCILEQAPYHVPKEYGDWSPERKSRYAACMKPTPVDPVTGIQDDAVERCAETSRG